MASTMASIPALKDVHAQMKTRMEKTVEDFRANLLSTRTGRAERLHMLDQVKVDYYGTDTPISQVAQILTPEPQLIQVKPWEKTMVAPIEKAIRTAGLGFNPMHDGEVIRVPVPQMTEERRKETVKHLAGVLEDHKTAIRNIRRDGNDHVKKAAKEKLISADDEKLMRRRRGSAADGRRDQARGRAVQGEGKRDYDGVGPAGRAHSAWGGHFVTGAMKFREPEGLSTGFAAPGRVKLHSG